MPLAMLARYGRNRQSAMVVKRRIIQTKTTTKELDACFVVRDHNGQALAYI
jgi:hypothetical protein